MNQSGFLSQRSKYPSMSSLASAGIMPPGHTYVPRRFKPEKPFGPTFISIMNRTWRGDGRKYICYAIISMCICILFVCATGLYVGHRNVSRITPVLRTEGFGAIFMVIALCFWCLTFHLIYKARVASNRWRRHVRVRHLIELKKT